jgi:hypothetical protein
MPHAIVSGAVGRASSFEVVVGEGPAAKVAYSKLQTGSFPDFEALAKELVAAAT